MDSNGRWFSESCLANAQQVTRLAVLGRPKFVIMEINRERESQNQLETQAFVSGEVAMISLESKHKKRRGRAEMRFYNAPAFGRGKVGYSFFQTCTL